MIDALLRILMAAALLATSASVLALLLGAAGIELLTVPHAVVLIAAGAVAFLGFFIIQLMAQQRFGSRPFNSLLKQHSPKWMRWLCNGLGLSACFLWFFLLAYRRYEPPSGGVSSLIAGTLGLFVSPATFLTFYAYRGLRPQLRRHCSRGHEMPVGASYCPECGEHVRQSADLSRERTPWARLIRFESRQLWRAARFQIRSPTGAMLVRWETA